MFAPKILSYAAKKTESHIRQKFEGFSQQNATEADRVSDIFKHKNSAKKKGDSEKVGEYIDFEEID